MSKVSYVRVDSSNTHNMIVDFQLWPFDDKDEDVYNYVTSNGYYCYEKAAEAAMNLLKNPQEVLKKESALIDDERSKELVEKLMNVEGYYIVETLCLFDEDWTCIDCPSEYLYNVGQVFKDVEQDDENVYKA